MKRNNADKWFSYYIRLRDAIWGEHGPCVTCGRPVHWKEADCGHYMTREKPMTRYNEQNCALQCKACNDFRKGEQALFARAIDRRYGNGTAEKLENLSRIRGQKIHTAAALADIANEYRTKAKQMAKKRGISI